MIHISPSFSREKPLHWVASAKKDYALPGLWFNAGDVHAFTPPRRILRNEADLDAWVAEVRTSVIEKLSNGPVQI